MQATLAVDLVAVQFFYTARAGGSFKRSFNIRQVTVRAVSACQNYTRELLLIITLP